MNKLLDENFLGFGLGLRSDYYQQIIDEKPAVDWFEILTENYLVDGGKPLYFLDKIRADYPMVMHGVSMSIGSTDPLDYTYLKQLKALAERVEPQWISDHLCWTGQNQVNLHDLMPLPYTREAINHVAARIREVQDFLGRQLVIENVSSYVTYREDEMTEWDFIGEVTKAADCHLLLDVNNVYVSARNHGFDPLDYISALPISAVRQLHLAGHTDYGSYVVDTHDQPVPDPVWDLAVKVFERFGAVPAMIERDDNMPAFSELMAELAHLRRIAKDTLLVAA
ncbi:MAG: DUF692 domain-containing protein [Oceanospirillaceae bacterium]